MKKNKAFTLIELLAVIVILAIILVVAAPKILDAINKSRLSTYSNQKELVSKAAQLYTTTNVDILPTVIGNTSFIKLSDLISGNYIKDVKDPMDKSTCSTSNSGVLVTKETDGYKYEPYLQCTNYKEDITLPDINHSISSNQLTVKAYDETSLSFDKNLIDRVVLPSTILNGIKNHSVIARIKIKQFNSSTNSVLNIFNNASNFELKSNMVNLFYNLGQPDCQYLITNTANTVFNIAYVVNDSSILIQKENTNFSCATTSVNLNIQERGIVIGQEQDTLDGTFDLQQTFNGYLYELLIFNRVLTTTEVNNYMESNNIIDSSLVGYYKLNEGQGTVLKDSSINNYHGTIYGSTWVKNSGIKEIRVKQGATLINSSNLSTAIFVLSAGNYTIEVEDNAGNISTKSVTI